MDEAYAVIMAGGGGTRLWPVSRRERPKQVLRLFGERTMFQLAVDRLLPLLPPERILVVAVEEQAEVLKAQVPDLPEGNYLLEPCPRGTASVVGLAAVYLHKHCPGAAMACLAADHYISDVEAFRHVLRSAFTLAGEGDLVTLGIRPTYPATGFGYIHAGEPRGEFEGLPAYRVLAFKEKPGLEEASRYLASGEYSWNSGMFVWQVDTILHEIRRLMPGLAAGLSEIEAALGRPDERHVLERVWQGLERQTVDYGIMERARNVSVIPAENLGWWDIGGWDRLFELRQADSDGNLVLGKRVRTLATKGTLIYQDPDVQDRLIATLGVENLIVIDTGDALLVCGRESAEDIRRLVEMLARDGEDRYL
jgi:mannose-1-phosphate guanylyltransferase